jgi:nickel-dependent lactate racemase
MFVSFVTSNTFQIESCYSNKKKGGYKQKKPKNKKKKRGVIFCSFLLKKLQKIRLYNLLFLVNTAINSERIKQREQFIEVPIIPTGNKLRCCLVDLLQKISGWAVAVKS